MALKQNHRQFFAVCSTMVNETANDTTVKMVESQCMCCCLMLLRHFTKLFLVYYLINKQYSDCFKEFNVVKQGCVISLLLFSRNIDDLFAQL